MTDKTNKTIYVTQPNLPPLKKLQPYLEEIWKNKILTNDGPFHKKFEKTLAEHLEVENINLFTNATIALIVSLQALHITGEVITTPFSFVATTHSLKWNGITPVFCDIEETTLNIDPDKIEALITPKTTAIMPVHVYGHPCDTEKIQAIADKYGLKVIYDAAHAFDVKKDSKTILNEGDLSVLSFHGTKLFTTFEGGAIITKDKKLKERIDFLKNFGIAGQVTVIAPGINGKMNEFQAVIGILGLEIVKEEIAQRKIIAEKYKALLKSVNGIKIFMDMAGVIHNYAYFPILINENEFGVSRDLVYEELTKNNILARRYFFPLISNFPSYKGLESSEKENLPVANKIADQVLCLPIYGSLGLENVELICDMLIGLTNK